MRNGLGLATRPIAAGTETVKTALNCESTHWQAFKAAMTRIQPTQLGCGTKDGAAVQILYGKGYAIKQDDKVSAFQKLLRQAIHDTIDRDLPEATSLNTGHVRCQVACLRILCLL